MLFYVNKYCSIEKGSFVFNSEIEKKEMYNLIFYDIYESFDFFMERNFLNNLPKNNIYFVPYYYKHYFQFFLRDIHQNYYQTYFKFMKFYKEEQLEMQDGDVNQHYLIEKKTKVEEEPKPLSFCLILKLNKNYYNTLFKLNYQKLSLTSDEENIKNFLIPKNKILELNVQFRSVLSNQVIHLKIRNIKYINNIISCYENNNELILKNYLESLFHVIKDSYGEKIIIDLSYKQFSLKTQRLNQINYNLLQKISIMLRNNSNDKLKNIIDGIKYIKTIKQCFIDKDKDKILFTFKIFQQSQVIKKDNKQIITSINSNESNLYRQMFGSLKISKAEKRIKEKYTEDYNFSYENDNSFFLLY